VEREEEKTKMKVALIGYGYWGKIVRKYIEADGLFELAAICCHQDLFEEPPLLITHELDDIVKDSTIEAVFVCTPIGTHYELCKKFLLAGKHVFVEKPTVRAEEDLEELLQYAEKNKVILFTDYIYTESPSIKKMKRVLPKIGEVCRVEGEISQFGNFYPQDSVQEVIGVHLFSILEYLFPSLQVQMREKIEMSRLTAYGVTLQMVLDNQAQVFLTCNLLSAKKMRWFKIYGTMGSLVFDMMDSEANLRFYQYHQTTNGVFDLDEVRTWQFDECNNLTNMIRTFADAIAVGNNKDNVAVACGVHRILKQISSM
jgi:predicted dehydrogenase